MNPVKLRSETPRVYSIERLIILAFIGSAILWVPEFDPRKVNYAFGQIIFRVMEFRTAFVFLLFVMAIRQKRGYGRTLVLTILVTLPIMTSGGAGFSQALILFFIAFIAEGRILVSSAFFRRNSMVGMGTLALASSLLLLAIVWNGAIKPVWREKIREGEVALSMGSRLQQFFVLAGEEVFRMDWKEGTRATAKRTSDVPMMMGHVIDRVPSQIDHTSGKLVWNAVEHVTRPRFLFPNKRNLGSDSTLVREYAGIAAAGAESNTSIGLGYLIELYIDYGEWGMIVAAGFLGFVVGLGYRAIYLVCPSIELYYGVLSAIMLQHFISLDGSLAKMLGGLIMAFIVMGSLMYFFGGAIDRFLIGPKGRSRSPRSRHLSI